MWQLQECDNEDSCSTGQLHLYPDPGTHVFVVDGVEGRIVGTGTFIPIPRGINTVGEHVDHQAHLVSIEVTREGDLALAWVDLDDLLEPSKEV